MRSKKAFTLIELLVVIAIIAILAAILFPVFASAKERARQTKCLNNLKQLSAAFQQYCINFDDTVPNLSSTMAGEPPDWCGSPWVGKQVYPEDGQLWSYTRNREIYLCPTDSKTPAGEIGGDWYFEDFALSYSVNYKLQWQESDPRQRRKLDATVGHRASKILLLMHEDRKTINDGYFVWDISYDSPSDIHYEGTTVSYCDGHARYCRKIELDRQVAASQWDPELGRK